MTEKGRDGGKQAELVRAERQGRDAYAHRLKAHARAGPQAADRPAHGEDSERR